MAKLVTIVETPSFHRDADGEISEEELLELQSYLAENPTAGALVRDTGGVRKMRWAASGRGKRGGGRVIYYFHDHSMPLYLLKFFTKASKSDLAGKEKKALSVVVDAIVKGNKGSKSGG